MMDMAKYEFDDGNPKSIEEYAKQLLGKSFYDVIGWKIERDYNQVTAEQVDSYANKHRKGGLGNLLENVYFNYKSNSDPHADFVKAGVELKVTPYEKNKKGELRAGERLVLTMISYNSPVEEDFFKSHLWEKCRLLLLVYYLRDKTLKSNLMYSIDYVTLFTPPAKDLEIIRQDYRRIIEKIKAGKAEELSEGDTIYLGACTKGATAAKSIVPQFYPPYTLAKKRAFCYKNSYMTYVLNQYIVNDVNTYEEIITDPAELEKKSFEEIITNKINQYIGTSDEMLCAIFNREYNNNKAQWIELAYRMLGIKSNRAEEFAKANIVPKAIRLDEKGSLRENSPLPQFSFRELVNEEWEDSTLYEYLSETKFLFVIYQKHNSNYILKGCMLWNMPAKDLEKVKSEWEAIRDVARTGIEFQITSSANGPIVKNNLPKKSDAEIIHIRPHTPKRYYQFADGSIIGNGTLSDSDLLPNGERMPKQSFWLNNTYIVDLINQRMTEN